MYKMLSCKREKNAHVVSYSASVRRVRSSTLISDDGVASTY